MAADPPTSVLARGLDGGDVEQAAAVSVLGADQGVELLPSHVVRRHEEVVATEDVLDSALGPLQRPTELGGQRHGHVEEGHVGIVAFERRQRVSVRLEDRVDVVALANVDVAELEYRDIDGVAHAVPDDTIELGDLAQWIAIPADVRVQDQRSGPHGRILGLDDLGRGHTAAANTVGRGVEDVAPQPTGGRRRFAGRRRRRVGLRSLTRLRMPRSPTTFDSGRART